MEVTNLPEHLQAMEEKRGSVMKMLLEILEETLEKEAVPVLATCWI